MVALSNGCAFRRRSPLRAPETLCLRRPRAFSQIIPFAHRPPYRIQAGGCVQGAVQLSAFSQPRAQLSRPKRCRGNPDPVLPIPAKTPHPHASNLRHASKSLCSSTKPTPWPRIPRLRAPWARKVARRRSGRKGRDTFRDSSRPMRFARGNNRGNCRRMIPISIPPSLSPLRTPRPRAPYAPQGTPQGRAARP